MNNDTNPSESHDHFVKKAVLGGILATYLKKHPRGVAIGTQLLSWHKVVTSILGDSFTTRSKAVKIDNQRLVITCTDVATVSELFLHKEELLAAYKQLFHSLAFSELLFLYKYDENKTTPTSSLTPCLLYTSSPLMTLQAHDRRVERIGICSGGGLFGLDMAYQHGCDTYITGDANHIAYHQAKELPINLICGGHYYTETFGVNRLAAALQKEFGLTYQFFDLPTHL